MTGRVVSPSLHGKDKILDLDKWNIIIGRTRLDLIIASVTSRAFSWSRN